MTDEDLFCTPGSIYNPEENDLYDRIDALRAEVERLIRELEQARAAIDELVDPHVYAQAMDDLQQARRERDEKSRALAYAYASLAAWREVGEALDAIVGEFGVIEDTSPPQEFRRVTATVRLLEAVYAALARAREEGK